MAPSFLPRVLLFAGGAAWLAVFAAAFMAAEGASNLLEWSLASALFIGCYVRNVLASRISFIALGLQSGCVTVMAVLICNGYEGLLLVLTAAQLAMHANARLGLLWIGAQTLALGVAIGIQWAPQAALLLTPPYLGFELLLFAALRLFAEERRTSERLGQANEALQRLQSQLAHKTRIEERLRIAHDMHDVLGHHLTALSLNLELAVHESGAAARMAIRTAHSLARALLSDVKELVSSAADDAPVDLPRELNQLRQDLLRPKVHIEYASDLLISDVRTGRALLRVVQEIITNAIRHGEAENVWICIERAGEQVTLVARDDGSGCAAGAEGFGLSGMRRRIEELGGTLRAASASGSGFEVRAELPYTGEEAA